MRESNTKGHIMGNEAQQEQERAHVVAVVGAGPAGLYAARKLAEEGCKVVLINRDIKPGGLAEYGIYLDKHKMKEGLRKQFRKILAMPEVSYFGGVKLGQEADLTLEEIEALDFSAVLFAIGAQGTRSLGLPGEEGTTGLFHAKDLVYHYNQLPPLRLPRVRRGPTCRHHRDGQCHGRYRPLADL